ncbi:unnamed protein product [Schistosoma curassoni]|uniref:Uncharacterized protein n=1 Tax=Schistosoma curassoni TaxID=6186 RepID=A0A183K0Z4_9TREM|nr:unnamed protein product [Schistosoma curassoni]
MNLIELTGNDMCLSLKFLCIYHHLQRYMPYFLPYEH